MSSLSSITPICEPHHSIDSSRATELRRRKRLRGLNEKNSVYKKTRRPLKYFDYKLIASLTSIREGSQVKTSSNQRLGKCVRDSAEYTNTKTRCATTRSKAPEKKTGGAANLQSSHDEISKFPGCTQRPKRN